MKRLLKTILLACLSMLSVCVQAADLQAILKKEYTKLEKEGWRVFSGDPSMSDQLKANYMMQMEFDENLFPKYIISSVVSDPCATLEEADRLAANMTKVDIYAQTTAETVDMSADGLSKHIVYCRGERVMETLKEDNKTPEVTFYWDEAQRTCLQLPYIRKATLVNRFYRRTSKGYEVCATYALDAAEWQGKPIGKLFYYLNASDKTAEVVRNAAYTTMTDIEIPASVLYDGMSYRVTGIADDAFYNCTKLASVSIPEGVTRIGYMAFGVCSSLAAITLPQSLTHIGTAAFMYCSRLKSITIPEGVESLEEGSTFQKCTALKEVRWDATSCTIDKNSTGKYYPPFADLKGITSFLFGTEIQSIPPCLCSGLSGVKEVYIPATVTSIGTSAFKDCPKLTVYTASSAAVPNVPAAQVHIVTQEQLLFHYPFSVYAREYVQKRVNSWQQKGEFERSDEWQKRVNEQTREEKVKELLAEAEKLYVAHYQNSFDVRLNLGKYDADNEVFVLNDEQYGTAYLAVPMSDAQSVKTQWDKKKIDYQMHVIDDKFKLSYVSVTLPNGKEYTYRNTDAVQYNMAEAEYNFAPIELNLASSSQSRQNVTRTKVKLGKSEVDMHIPESDAVNEKTFVIIFANEDYKNVAPVPFAKNDGAVFQKYCQKTLGIPVTNIHYVENASFNDMRIQLAWLNDVCNAFDGQASLIVYYAGHGIPDEASKSAYLLPVDGDGRYVQSAYKLDDMYQKLGAMKAKSITVFMDACFSGSKREDGMLASARGVAVKVRSGAPTGRMVIFSAATGDETAYPNNDEQHGMFTYYLLKKLQETKGDVTLQDLGEYITTNVRQQSIVKNGKSQTPTVSPSADADGWQEWKLK